MKWQSWIIPSVVALCQGTSVIAWVGVMMTLTHDPALGIPYAVFMGLSISTCLSLVFTKSARTSKAVEILLKAPGGWLIIFAFGTLTCVVYYVQPVLVKSGYTTFQALGVTLLAQVPMATTASVFSSQFIVRVFSEVYYKRAMDALVRELQARRLLEHAEIIRQTVKDMLDTSMGKPMEPQLKPLLLETELRITNMKGMIELLCVKSPTYTPPQYHKLLSEVLAETRTRLSNEGVPVILEATDPLDYLFHAR